MENVITKIEIQLFPDDNYRVFITKRFSEEYGGGESTIAVGAQRNIHIALEVAKSAVTVTKTYRDAFEASGVAQ